MHAFSVPTVRVRCQSAKFCAGVNQRMNWSTHTHNWARPRVCCMWERKKAIAINRQSARPHHVAPWISVLQPRIRQYSSIEQFVRTVRSVRFFAMFCELGYWRKWIWVRRHIVEYIGCGWVAFDCDQPLNWNNQFYIKLNDCVRQFINTECRLYHLIDTAVQCKLWLDILYN